MSPVSSAWQDSLCLLWNAVSSPSDFGRYPGPLWKRDLVWSGGPWRFSWYCGHGMTTENPGGAARVLCVLLSFFQPAWLSTWHCRTGSYLSRWQLPHQCIRNMDWAAANTATLRILFWSPLLVLPEEECCLLLFEAKSSLFQSMSHAIKIHSAQRL